MRVVILQHGDHIPPGHLGTVLEDADVDVTTIMVHRGEPLPDLDHHDAIVSLGGVMGVYDEDANPWLVDEAALLADAVDRGIPTLGICLGAQILAKALGGRAYKADAIEAGVVTMDRTAAGAEDTVTRHLDAPVVVWHQDTWDLPPGATLLAASGRYRQAFRLGSALALQPHPEASLAIVDGWLDEGGRDQLVGAGIDADGFRDRVAAGADRQSEMARRLFGAWVGGLTG